MENRYLERADVRRIMNYIRNKKLNVCIIDEMNNSMEINTKRSHTGVVDSFTLGKIDGYCEYNLIIKFTDGYELEIWLDTQYLLLSKFGDRDFISGFINAGPWCYFNIIRV